MRESVRAPLVTSLQLHHPSTVRSVFRLSSVSLLSPLPDKTSSSPRNLCFLVVMAEQEVVEQPSDTLSTLKTESETLKTKLEDERAKLHDVERKNR